MEKDKKKKVDKDVAQNKTGKTATGKPKNPIELDPQLKYDDTGGLRQEAIDLAAPDLDEGRTLTIAQRQKRARIFKRNLPKIERAREMAKRRQASQPKLQKRAEKAARELLKRRFAGRKGTPYAELSVSEKIQVDKKLEGKAKLIKKIAMRLLPKIRRAEYERLKSFYKGEPMKSLHQEPSKVNEAFEQMLGVFSTEDKSTIKTMVEQHKPEDLVDIIENMIDDLAKEGNPLVDTLREMLDQVAPKNPIYESIQRKAEGNHIPFEILEEVFNRGLEAWDGKRGTQEQYAFDRVNSYISHGKAYDLDADLREGRADVKRTKVKLPDGRVVWRSYRKSTEVEKRDARDEMEESKNTPYVKPFYGSSDKTKQSGWKASNKHGKVKYFGNDFKASAHKHAGIAEGSDCTDPMKRQEGTDSLTKKYKKQTPGQKTNEQFSSFFESMHKKHEDETASDERKELEYTKRGKAKPDEKDEPEVLRRAHIQVKKKIIDEAEVWDKPNPKKESKPLTPAQKAKAKARAKSAGRPYPNMVDNIWAANEEFDLHAERAEGGKKHLGSFKTKEAAAAHVEKLEDSGKFPEGHDAVLTHKKTGEKHVYTDSWDKMKEEIDSELQESQTPRGKKIGTVNGYHIHDLGADHPHKDKRYLAYHNEYAWISHTAPTKAEITKKSKEYSESKPERKRTEHDDWRDDMKHRIKSGEVRRAVMSRRGMKEETSLSLNEAFVLDTVAGIGTTITAEQAGINITPQFQHYPGVEELNQLLAVESLIKEGFGKMLEEVDEEGKMARGQLSSLIKNAQSLVAKMKDDKQLDAWIQSKITKAADYINAVAEYLDNNKQDVDE